MIKSPKTIEEDGQCPVCLKLNETGKTYCDKHLSYKFLGKLIDCNPYPEDIFTPLRDQLEIKKYVNCLIDNGFSSERIHAHWMRYTWQMCCDKLKQIISDEMEEE